MYMKWRLAFYEEEQTGNAIEKQLACIHYPILLDKLGK